MKLIKDGGFDTIEVLPEQCVLDSVAPGICVIPGCDHTSNVEPDQRQGYCEACGGNTVQAALVLAGWI